MKKNIGVVTLIIALLLQVSICIATEDQGEGHICFKRIDSNHDDLVTQEELLKFFPNNSEFFKEMDLDQDDKISHDEYEEFWYSRDN